MIALLASLKKETLLLLRDWHALLVLFIMPSLFITIMSQALQGPLGEHSNIQIKGEIILQSKAETAIAFSSELREQPNLQLTLNEQAGALSIANNLFSILILPAFDDALNGINNKKTGVNIAFAPEVQLRDRLLIKSAVQASFAHFNTIIIANDLGYDKAYAEEELLKQAFIFAEGQTPEQRPNAVQQSVPAWLIFAMFFISIPISTTVIQERQQRTLMRLRTLGLSLSILYTAKLAPYFIVNILQLIIMLFIGSVLLPLTGSEGLSLDVNLVALLLISMCVSICALGLASLIASIARTVEQATAASGTANILFAALGGIMIPVFIMPQGMQTLSQLSPMAWALNGFLEVLIRDGNVSSILVPSGKLMLLGIILWQVSIYVLSRDSNHE